MKRKNSQTVYLLHGWSISQENQQKWQIFINELEKKGFSPVFLNIPGLSSPLDQVWQLSDFVTWLSTQLPKEPVWLAGHSFGGQIAIKFAAKYPDRVERLILIDSSGIRDWALKAVIKRKVFYVVSKIGKIFFKSTLARKFIYLLARERDYLNAPPLLRRTMSLVLDEQVIKDLDKIQAPTTIFWGENDQTTPVKIGQLIKSKIKNSQLVLIEGARHSPQYTHSQQLADLFLEKTKI